MGYKNENLWCGVWFSNGLVNVDPDNWLPRIFKLESHINLWKCRSLSFVFPFLWGSKIETVSR